MSVYALAPPQGWQCPACGGVYAPWMAKCTECKPKPTGLRDRMDAAQLPVPHIAGPLSIPATYEPAGARMQVPTPGTCAPAAAPQVNEGS